MRLIAYTGKGGVGKSVVSCATALRSAQLGYKTLVMSSDPAHTLSDIFGSFIGSEEVRVAENLWAVHTDPVDEALRHYSILMEYVVELFKTRDVDDTVAYELANLPGMTGAASLLRAHDYYLNGKFDVLVLDMVPSGDALRLLYMPYLVGRFSRRLLKFIAPAVDLGRALEPLTGMPLPSKKAIEKQVELLERMEGVRKLLMDQTVTSVRLVMNPDKFSTMNAKRTYMQSSVYGVNTDLAIINKLIPDEVQDPYLQKWKKIQEVYVQQARLDLQPLPFKLLYLYDEELQGLEGLRKASEDLFGEEDPTQVYHKGRPLEVMIKDNELELILFAPLRRKEDAEVERIGDEVIVHLTTDAGCARIFVPLPTISFKYRLKGAKLINDRLHILFTE